MVRNHLLASCLCGLLILVAGAGPRVCPGQPHSISPTKKLKVCIVQQAWRTTLEANLQAPLDAIDTAKSKGCRLVVFPEHSLFCEEVATETPKISDIDAAIQQIARRAAEGDIYVVFGTHYKNRASQTKWHPRGVVVNNKGTRQMFYEKYRDTPQSFEVDGIACNLVVCADRWYRQICDLPCLTQGVQVIVEISGGHGGDDGRPDLRFHRYPPWAQRNNAFILVANPPHYDTDDFGNSPWGGHSGIFNPDGSMEASLAYDVDKMIIRELDMALATRSEAQRRRNNPIMKPWWDMGKKLLEGRSLSAAGFTRYTGAQTNVKIAVAQMKCSRNIADNVRAIESMIDAAANNDADIVVFPELAVTGNLSVDIEQASRGTLDEALTRISAQANHHNICAIVGMPYFVNGYRKNCAFVIGDDGRVKTRYDQISTKCTALFRAGVSTKSMWFQVKGVYAIVTIGSDALWTELAELAAGKGNQLHFHIAYEHDTTNDATIMRKQRYIQFVTYGTYSAIANAANPAGITNPSSSAGGVSMICENLTDWRNPPNDVELFVYYGANIICSAGNAEQTILYATRQVPRKNSWDRTGKRAAKWREWVKAGMQLIEIEIDEP